MEETKMVFFIKKKLECVVDWFFALDGWDAVLFYLASIQVFLFAVVNTNFDFLVHFAVTDLLYKFKDCSSYIYCSITDSLGAEIWDNGKIKYCLIIVELQVKFILKIIFQLNWWFFFLYIKNICNLIFFF